MSQAATTVWAPSQSSPTFHVSRRHDADDSKSRLATTDYEYSRQTAPTQMGVDVAQANSFNNRSNGCLSHKHTPSRSMPNSTASHSRHPSLSVNTNGLHNPRASTEVIVQTPAQDSSPLQADLDTFRTNLETVWKETAQSLSRLHTAVKEKDGDIDTLLMEKSRLEETLNRQQKEIQGIMEQLHLGESRLNRALQEIQEIRDHAAKEKAILNQANSRLWKDIARLEGEKRELKVRLESQAEVVRLCNQRAEGPKPAVSVKMEDDEHLGNPHIPISQVEQAIHRRLKSQTEEYSREINGLYDSLAQARQRVTELEAHLHTMASPQTTIDPQQAKNPHMERRAPLQQINILRRGSLPGHIQQGAAPSPTTPVTASGSAISESSGSFRAPPTNSSSNPKSNGYSKIQNEYPTDSNVRRRHSVFEGGASTHGNHGYDHMMARRFSQSTLHTDRRSMGSTSDSSPVMNSMTPLTSANPNVGPNSNHSQTVSSRYTHPQAPQQTIQIPSAMPPPTVHAQPTQRTHPLQYTQPQPSRYAQQSSPPLQFQHPQPPPPSPVMSQAQPPSQYSQPLSPSVPQVPLPHPPQFAQLSPPVHPPQPSDHLLPQTAQVPPLQSPSQPVPSMYAGPSQGWRPIVPPNGQPIQQSPSPTPTPTQPQREACQDQSRDNPCSPHVNWSHNQNPDPQQQGSSLPREKYIHARAPSVTNVERPLKRSRTDESISPAPKQERERPAPARRIAVPVTNNGDNNGESSQTMNTNGKRPSPVPITQYTEKPSSTATASAPVSGETSQTQTQPPPQTPVRQQPSPAVLSEKQQSSIAPPPPFPPVRSHVQSPPRPQTLPPPYSSQVQGPRHRATLDMSPDEQVMFMSIGRVLAKRKDEENYKCALCRIEKAHPATSFGEDTPIGSVTKHVKETHVAFWNEISTAYYAQPIVSSM